MNDVTPDAATSANFRSLVQAILNDGHLDDSRIDQIERALKSDWIVDRSEIERLFQINQRIGNRDEEIPRWTEVFVDNVTRLVVLDLDSPGEIDDSEGNWLSDLLERYPAGNASEAKLLAGIRELAKIVRGRLAERLSSSAAASDHGSGEGSESA